MRWRPSIAILYGRRWRRPSSACCPAIPFIPEALIPHEGRAPFLNRRRSLLSRADRLVLFLWVEAPNDARSGAVRDHAALRLVAAVSKRSIHCSIVAW